MVLFHEALCIYQITAELANTAITYAGMRVKTQAPKLLKRGK